MSDETNQNEKLDVREGEQKLLLDHNYDGIQELDHMLPRWWLGLFYATIVFGAFYCGYYLAGMGPTPQQELAAQMLSYEKAKLAAAPAASADNSDALLAAFKDPSKLKAGAAVFAGKCIPCHGDKAQGVIGPNLTDDFWLHGEGSLKDIAKVVTNGVPDKGMPPWGPVLTPEELTSVVAYVHSLHGTNPPGGKAPQGEKEDFKD